MAATFGPGSGQTTSRMLALTGSYQTIHTSASAVQAIRVFANNPTTAAIDVSVQTGGGGGEAVVSVPAKTTYCVWEGDTESGGSRTIQMKGNGCIGWARYRQPA